MPGSSSLRLCRGSCSPGRRWRRPVSGHRPHPRVPRLQRRPGTVPRSPALRPRSRRPRNCGDGPSRRRTRGMRPDGIAPILEALKSKDNETRRVAVRALGRLERPNIVGSIAPVLLNPAPVVRAEAASALAQAASAGGDPTGSDLLIGQLERETHPLVRGALAEAVGRLPYKDAQGVRQAERAIVGALKPSKPPGRSLARPATCPRRSWSSPRPPPCSAVCAGWRRWPGPTRRPRPSSPRRLRSSRSWRSPGAARWRGPKAARPLRQPHDCGAWPSARWPR